MIMPLELSHPHTHSCRGHESEGMCAKSDFRTMQFLSPNCTAIEFVMRGVAMWPAGCGGQPGRGEWSVGGSHGEREEE